MSRCKNDILLNKIGLGKLNANDEVTFTLLDDLPDCRKIKTNNYVSVSGENSFYDPGDVPENVFECMIDRCVNTGTLFLDAGQGEAPEAVFKAQYDATEFGVITFYVKKGDGGSAKADPPNVTGTVELSNDTTFANSDVYNFSIPASAFDANNFAPVLIDLTRVPDSTTGTGWEQTQSGAYIRITSTGTGEGEVKGISSIVIYDSIEDFEISDVVKIACLSGIDGADEIEAAEASCFGSGYNTDDLSFERTITGRAITPNYWKLNPMLGKGEQTTESMSVTVQKTVVAADGSGGEVVISDLNQDECGMVGVEVVDCNVSDSWLTRIVVPMKVSVDEKHYVVVPNGDGTTSIYFNARHIGREVIITYPKAVTVEGLVADEKFIGTRRVRMTYVERRIVGGNNVDSEVIKTYNNVLITSFPNAITNDGEQEFEFTIRIQKDRDGHYYRVGRVIA